MVLGEGCTRRRINIAAYHTRLWISNARRKGSCGGRYFCDILRADEDLATLGNVRNRLRKLNWYMTHPNLCLRESPQCKFGYDSLSAKH